MAVNSKKWRGFTGGVLGFITGLIAGGFLGLVIGGTFLGGFDIDVYTGLQGYELAAYVGAVIGAVMGTILGVRFARRIAEGKGKRG
jgi:MFS family permease